ncbi:hypothetical protein COW36_15665 [bacterium (Candidatus Blackallbacteria) CG17_big_fil_post_rev_8_21_14_2_50_48_46]|uniref:protein O-GlcNAc transferase n=1 Tax=bacterium (Candidatus Blackallbacteria) CG17_big_fil_post_rev_8_21_14_2_50_48_46 TaxID=2014261 RepID=A0A2M7G240_9BACT|nr:MAG: hypothetical protein COW64_15205 [bacterium (Candidatus Blackallbacteria) CG18_big_fil_WC_8_21_14_2_50_49_26]PIW15840.1 MAG: hypothetical protein COW36_15665 [bacterium (Candidatus Blackallbacteria) CG17_big_fil_post_rev_8_21_14_2_50_48_46]PIW48211.1 MAG: hypothetical protein COW20_10275 [bacterium (Candidatus Blackallbacteria) CG13_big_fil_rev_8_21_14_2_50_49_14]
MHNSYGMKGNERRKSKCSANKHVNLLNMAENTQRNPLEEKLQGALKTWQNQDHTAACAQLETLNKEFPHQPEILHLLGVFHYSLNQAEQAEPLLEEACMLCPDYDDFYFNWGNACLALQKWEKALHAFRKAGSLNPDLHEAGIKQAQILEELKIWPMAEILWRDLLQKFPQAPDLILSLARNLVAQDQLQEARNYYLQLLQQTEIPSSVLFEIGQFCISIRDYENAFHCLNQAPGVFPETAQYYHQFSSVLFQLKQFPQALSMGQKALELEPQAAESWWNQAQILLELKDNKKALFALKKALDLAPEFSELLIPLAQEHLDRFNDDQATLLLELNAETISANTHLSAEAKAFAHYGAGLATQRGNAPEKAIGHFQRAQKTHPQNLLYPLAETLCLPVVYADTQSLSDWRQRIETELPKCLNRLLENAGLYQLPQPLQQIPLLFHLAYQGYDDRQIHTLVGDFWQNRFEQDGLLLQAKLSEKPHFPLRIGFVSSFFFAHAVSHIYAPLIQFCAQDPELEIFCFSLSPQADSMTELLRAKVQQFVSLAGQDHLSQAQRIAEANLDILVYTDIGMESSSYLLGLQRLAPVQCVLGGHPVTTGLPQMDWAMSTHSSEPENAQHYYRERLFLRSSQAPQNYKPPELSLPLPTKQELGFSEKNHLYLCPMTLYKVHPEFDLALTEILEQDPLAELYFFKYHENNLHQHLLKRFEKSLGQKALQRVHFLPWLSRSEFTQVLAASEVCLDPFHFSAGNTTYLCMHTGTPLITWPSGLRRGRIAAAILERAGLQECIVPNKADFGKQAVDIACSNEKRYALKTKMQTVLSSNTNSNESFLELVQFFKNTSKHIL